MLKSFWKNIFSSSRSKKVKKQQHFFIPQIDGLEARVTPAATLTFTGGALALVSDANADEAFTISATGKVLNLNATGNITVDATVKGATGDGTTAVTVDLNQSDYAGTNLTVINLFGNSAQDKVTTFNVNGALDLTAVTGTTNIGVSFLDGTKNQDNDVSINALVKTQGNGSFNVNVNTNAGSSITIAAAGVITTGSNGASFDAQAGISTAGNLTTNNGTVQIKSPVSLTGDVVVSAGNGTVVFSSTIDGAKALTVNTTGPTTFTGKVGDGTELTGLTTVGGGAVTISGGTVETKNTTVTANQTYSGPVTLTADTQFLATDDATKSAITFSKTVDGAGFTLKWNAGFNAGGTTFGGAVGSTGALKSVETIGGKTFVNGGSVKTVETQDYFALELGDNTVLTSTTNKDITFKSTINGAKTLSVVTTGKTSFEGVVGEKAPLTSITTSAAGTVTAGKVITTGLQSYGGDAKLGSAITTTNSAFTVGGNTTLGADVTVTTGTGLVTFTGTVDGAFELDVESSGATAFGGKVGDGAALVSLTTVGGAVTISGGLVKTTGSQSFGGDVTVATNNLLFNVTANNGDITITGKLDGGAKDVTFDLDNKANTDVSATIVTNVGTLKVFELQGLAIFTGAVSATSLDVGNQVVNFSSTGTGGTITNAVAFDNTGTLTLGKSAGTQTYTGGLDTSGTDGTVTIFGTLATSGDVLKTGKITLGSNTILSAATKDINITDTVTGGGFSLTANSEGATTFGGAVTGLSSLTTDLKGTTNINGGSVTTTGAQTYNDAVTLGANTVLESTSKGDIKLASTVDGNAFTLEVKTSGVTTFGSAVTDMKSLTTDAGTEGSVSLQSVTTSDFQKYGENATLNGTYTTTDKAFSVDGTTTLAGNVTVTTGAGDVTFTGAVDGDKTLAVASTGAILFSATVGSTTPLTSLTAGAGKVTLGGGLVKTTGSQSFGGDVTLTNAAGTTFNVTDDAGDISITGQLDGGAKDVTFDSDSKTGTDVSGTKVTNVATLTVKDLKGTASFSGQVDATSLTVGDTVVNFSSTGTGGTITNAVAFDNTGTLTLGQSAGTQTYTAGLNTSGTDGVVTLNGTLKTTNTALTTGAITLASDTVLDAGTGDVTIDTVTGGSKSLTLTGKNVSGTSVSAVDALTLSTVTAAGSFTGAVSATSLNVGATVKDFSSTGTGGTITNAVAFDNTGTLTLGQSAGTQTYTAGLDTSGTDGLVTLNGTLKTTNTALKTGAITLASATVLDAGTGDVTIGGVTGGGKSLTLTGKNVSGTTVSGVDALTLSTVTAAGSFTGAVTATSLNVGATVKDFSSTGTGGTITDAVAFANTGTLTLGQAAGGQTYTGGLNTTATGGTVTLNGTLQTTDTALITGAITLGSNTILATGSSATQGDLTIGAVTGGNFDLTLTGKNVSGTTVSGVDALTLSTVTVAGSFTGAVTATSLNVGNTVVNFSSTGTGGTITDAVAFDNTGTLTLGQAAGTQVYTGGLDTFGTDGLVTLNGTLQTTKTALTTGPITLGSDTTLDSVDATITMGTVDGAKALVVNTTGDTIFTKAVGGGTQLTSVTTNAGGTTKINGATVTTTGAQTYNDAVVLGDNTILTSTTKGDITLATTVDGGAKTLSVVTEGVTTFGGAVSNMVTLTTDAPGSTKINGGSVTTTGNQTYNDAVILKTATLTTTANGNIKFSSTVDGLDADQSLTLDTGSVGTIQADFAVGSLKNLTITNSGGATFDKSVTTNPTGGLVEIKDTAAGKNVTFNGALVTPTLTVNAGTGAYNVQVIGTGTNITNAVTFNNTGTVTLGDDKTDELLFQGGLTSNVASKNFISGFVLTAGKSVGITTLSLDSDSTIDTTNEGGSPAGAVVTLKNQVLLNGFDLNVISGPTNGLTVVGKVEVTNGELIVLQGNLDLGNGSDDTTITVNQDTLFKANTGKINVNAKTDIVGGSNALTFQSDNINLSTDPLSINTIVTTSTVTLSPITSNLQIFIGGDKLNPIAVANKAGSLNFTQEQLQTIKADATDVIVGGQGYGGVVTIGELTMDNQLTIVNQGGGGKTKIVGNFTSTTTDQNGLEIIGSGATAILSMETIVTNGTPVIIADGVEVDEANALIDTTNGGNKAAGANVILTGGINGIFSSANENNNLNVTAGTTGNVSLGTLNGFTNNGGLANFVNSLTVSGNSISLPNDNNSFSGVVALSTANGSGAITIDDIDQASGVSLNAKTDATVNDVVATGLIGITADSNINVNGKIVSSTDTVSLTGTTTNLGGNTRLQGSNGVTVTGAVAGGFNSLTLDGGTAGALSITGDVTGVNQLSVTNSNGATFGGAVTAGSVQIADTSDAKTVAFNGNLSVTSGLTAANSGAYNVSLLGKSNSIGGPVNLLNTGTVTLGDANGDETTINGSFSTSGTLALQGRVIVLGNVLSGNYAITDGAGDLRLEAGGNLALNSLTSNAGAVTFVVNGNAQLGSIGASGKTVTSVSLTGFTGGVWNLAGVNAGTLTTNAGNYSVALNDDSTITNAVTFTNTGGVTLGNENTDAFTFVGGVTSDASVTTVNGAVTTTDTAIALGSATKGVVLAGTTVLSSGTSTTKLSGAVSGNFDLTVISKGVTTLGASVNVANFSTNPNGSTEISGGSVTTSGSQNYGDDVTLKAATVLNAGANVNLGIITGANDLTVNAAGFTTLAGAVNINSLTTDAAGVTTISGATITTTGNQSFGDAVSLDINDITLSGGAISLASVSSINNKALNLNSAEAVTLGGAVSVASLTTNAGGTTAINGGSVTTTGAQTYGDGISLGTNTTLTAGAALTTSSIAGNNSNLALNSGATGALAIGSITGVNQLTVTNSNGATFADVTAGSVQIADTANGSTVAFIGNLNVTGGLTAAFTANAYNVSLTGAANTLNGAVTLANSGSVTLGDNDGDGFNVGAVTVGNDSLSIQGAFNILGGFSAGDYKVTNAAGNFSLVADGNIGLGDLTSAAGTIFLGSGGSVSVGSIGANGAVGTVTLDGSFGVGGVWNLDSVTSNNLAVNAGNYSVALNGNSTIQGLVIFSNTGGVALGNEITDTMTFNGGVDSTASVTTVIGNVASSGDAITLGGSKGLVLSGQASLGSAGGVITLGVGGVNANNQDLFLDAAATGLITVSGAISGFNLLDIGNSAGTLFVGNVSGKTLSIDDTTGTIAFGNPGILSGGNGTVFLDTLATAPNAYSVSFFNATTRVVNPVSFLNTGGVVMGNDAADEFVALNGITVATGVSLSGIGEVVGAGGVAVSGNVAPGLSPGIITFVGGLAFNGSTSAFNVEINGYTVGTQFDQAVVAGGVTLANATLNTTSTGLTQPAIGQVITLISNDGIDPVNGTFNNLPEKTKLTVDGKTFVISYQGGDGNDVVLTFVAKQGVVASSGIFADPVTGIVSSIVTITTQGKATPIVVTPFLYFTGDLHVGTGDITGDGFDDVVIGAGAGAGPAVAVVDSQTGVILGAFFAYNPEYHGGVFVTVGDLDGDKTLEIITGAGAGGGPHVQVFDAKTFENRGGFYAYDVDFRGGVTVAAGDFDGDGSDEIVTGPGAGGGPNVRIYSGPNRGFAQRASFLAYAPSFTGGVFVAAGDVTGNTLDEIITGAGQGGGSQVTVFDGNNLRPLSSFFAYSLAFTGGVRVGATDFTGDGNDDIITGAGVGGAPHVKILDSEDQLVDQFFSGDINYLAGIFVA